MSLLAVRDLAVRFAGGAAVEALDLSIDAGESVALVGESGSGKTQTALALMGLSARSAKLSGSIRYADQELLGRSEKHWRQIRARRIAMVFQDPLAALNPYRRIGTQLKGIVTQHGLARGAAAWRRVLRMLEKTGLPDPERHAAAYPHQLSGGMRQRAMIAAALIAEPELIVADEPTAALDATLQVQILALLESLRHETGASLLLITHDLSVVARACERVLVMHRGRVVEHGATAAVFERPEHAQTERLLQAARAPQRLAPDMRCEERQSVLSVDGLSVRYRSAGGVFRRTEVVALQPLDLALHPGETLGVVGESGSGKTSLARAVLGLLSPHGGSVSFAGKRLPANLGQRSVKERRHLQIVFQDPVASLDPAMRVARIVAEPLSVHRPELKMSERHAEVLSVLGRVGLHEDLSTRFPHQLSGGQAQRVALARALIVKPSVLICDEAVASLDSSVRHGILKLIADEQRRSALSVIFIAHDLTVVQQLSHRVLVLYMGHVCEVGASDAVFARPLHPYTRGLIDSTPRLDANRALDTPPVLGEAASLMRPPSGCVFHPRCQYAAPRCAADPPSLSELAGRQVACWRAAELDLTLKTN